MKKIYFVADAHMSRLIYRNRPDISGDAHRALRSVVESVLEDEADEKALVFCGDNFDSRRPEPLDIAVFKSCVADLKAGGVRVLAVAGNHDKMPIEDAGQWLDLYEDVEWLGSGEVIDVCSVRMTGMDFVAGQSVSDRLAATPDCDVIVVHQPLAHLSPFESYTLESEGVPDGVAKALVAGHVHIPDIRFNSSGVALVSPGSTHARKINDKRGSYAVYDVDSGEFEIMPVRSFRAVASFKLGSEEDVSAAVAKIEAMVPKSDLVDDRPIVGVRYLEGLHPLYAERIADRFGDSVFLFPTIEAAGSPEIQAGEQLSEMSKIDVLRSVMEAMGMDPDGADVGVLNACVSVVDGDGGALADSIKQIKTSLGLTVV